MGVKLIRKNKLQNILLISHFYFYLRCLRSKGGSAKCKTHAKKLRNLFLAIITSYSLHHFVNTSFCKKALLLKCTLDSPPI